MLEAIKYISGQLRDAVCDPEGWTTALDTINRFVEGSGVVILSVEERLRHAPHSSDLQELMDDYFEGGWHSRDRREICVPLLRQNGIAFDHDCYEVHDRDPFHAEFLSRHGRKWFAGLAANLDGNLWCLALQRSPAQGAFRKSEMPRLMAVRETLENAASLSRVIGRAWLEGAISALNDLGGAAVVLDHAGRVLEMNKAARSIAGDTMTGRGFETTLRSQLPEARWRGCRAFQVSLEFAKRPYLVQVTPLRDKAGLLLSKASMFLQIRAQPVDPARILQHTYGLTTSEVRVAMALASGMSVEAMANAFSVASNTVRAQLKSTYAKTGVANQANLVTLIGGLGEPAVRAVRGSSE